MGMSRGDILLPQAKVVMVTVRTIHYAQVLDRGRTHSVPSVRVGEGAMIPPRPLR
jgi:hypothetical protein